MTSNGMNRRLARLFPRPAALVLPIDGGLIDGPIGKLSSLGSELTPELLASVDVVLGYRGALNAYAEPLLKTPYIINVSASTALSDPARKTLVQDVETAVRLGADAVAYQIHLTGTAEQQMLRDLGRVVDAADRFGLPVLATAYARRENGTSVDHHRELQEQDPPEFVVLLRHVVRVAAELGANLIKTTYTGSVDSFSAVIEAGMGVPVLAAGGPAIDLDAAIAQATGAVTAGALGIAYGRQIYMSDKPADVAQRLRHAIDGAASRRTNNK